MGLQAAMAAMATGGAAGLGQNIYEVAALTQELDTMQLTLRVKEVLTTNNICQKVRIIYSQRIPAPMNRERKLRNG